jgi:hypothetical protein
MRTQTLFAAGLAALAFAPAALADWAISWSSIDTGGTQNVAAGSYRVSSTLGQHDAANRTAFLNYAVTTGYQAGAVVDCRADFNGDGFVDFFDFNDFVDCFEGIACPAGKSADFNGDGFADFFDFDEFVAVFEAGC